MSSNATWTAPQTSGSYDFAPSMGESVLFAYSLCQIRRVALTQAHFEDAKMATNLMMARWSAKGVNLWQVDQQYINLTQGCATYPVPTNTIVMLDAYIGMNGGSAEIDRLILPISRTEYASYPNKQQQGFPTTFWFDRLLSPTVTLWPVPDGTVSTFNYYRLRQTQDSVLGNETAVEIPPYFWDAYVFGLAYRLALIWAQDKAPMLKAEADAAYADAVNQNVETSQVYVNPMISGYFR